MHDTPSEVTIQIQDNLQLKFDRSWVQEITARSNQNGPWDNWTLYQLAFEAEQATLIHRFDDLQCLSTLNGVDPLPHQLETARKVLTDMARTCHPCG